MLLAIFLLLFDASMGEGDDILHCAQPEVPENGHVIFPSNGPLKPGTLISYKCDVGFVHLGPEQRRCRPDGRWSKAPPICAVNVGLYKPGRERLGPAGAWVASNGTTDGDLEACRASAAGAAWSIDLLHEYKVYAVELLLKASRGNGASTANVEIEIWVGAAAGGADSLCYSHRGPLELNKLHTFVCTREAAGRQVLVKIPSGTLNLCEVFVLSTSAASAWQCGSLPGMESWGVEGGRCYHASREGLPWASAQSQCSLSGATLVGPVDGLLSRFLSSQLSHRAAPDAAFFWLGLSSSGGTTEWRWWNGLGLAEGGQWAGRAEESRGPQAAALSRADDWRWRPGLQTLWRHWLCQSPPLFCASPGVPAQGGVMLSSQTYGIGTTAYYYCNYGFVLQGTESRACLPNGTWSDVPPKCFAVNCGSPESLADGFVTLVNSSSAFGAVARHECGPGFALRGPPERRCGADGVWSEARPVCGRVDCGAVPALANGTVQQNGTGLGAIASHGCVEGFRLRGPPLRKCVESGVWEPEAPLCIQDSTVLVNMGGIGQLGEGGPTGTEADQSQWRHQTNMMTGFIVAVVILLIMIFLILFMLWKKKKLFYDNFSMSTVYAAPTLGGATSSSSSSRPKDAPLYAYNNPSLVSEERVYCAPASVADSHRASSDQDRRLSVLSTSDVYYSLAKVEEWNADHSGASSTSSGERSAESDPTNIALTQLELPPELLKVEKLPNGNFHLTLPCIRGGTTARRGGIPFPMDDGPAYARPPIPLPPQPRVPPRATRRPPRPKKFNTMVGIVRKKLSQTTSAIIDTLGTEATATLPRRSPLDISGPFAGPLPVPISGSDPDLRCAWAQRLPPPSSPTPTEILFSFDDGDDDAPEPPSHPPPPVPENIYEAVPAPTAMVNTYC